MFRAVRFQRDFLNIFRVRGKWEETPVSGRHCVSPGTGFLSQSFLLRLNEQVDIRL